MKTAISIVAASAALALAAPASAAVIVYVGGGPVQPDENVLFNVDQDFGTTVQGSTNNTGSLVNFSSNVSLDVTGSEGAARISAVTGSLDQLTISLANPDLFFTEFEFNLFDAAGTQKNPNTTSVTFFFSDGTDATRTVNFSGQNIFGFEATDGTQLTSIMFNSNGLGFQDVRQVRIGGIASNVPPVPEPATWAMLILGFGTVGGMMRRRSGAAKASRMKLTYA